MIRQLRVSLHCKHEPSCRFTFFSTSGSNFKCPKHVLQRTHLYSSVSRAVQPLAVQSSHTSLVLFLACSLKTFALQCPAGKNALQALHPWRLPSDRLCKNCSAHKAHRDPVGNGSSLGLSAQGDCVQAPYFSWHLRQRVQAPCDPSFRKKSELRRTPKF